MRIVKVLVAGAFVLLVGLTIIVGGRVMNLWQLGHVDELVWGVAPVAHASQSRRASPHESTSGTIDGNEVTITYGRPYMRGRMIFGRLVPYNRVWCPGADEATTIESARDLQFGSLTVPAGPHTIWLLPTAGTWTLIISKEPSGFHTNYNASADLGRVELTKRALDMPIEQLTFAVVKNPDGPGGRLTMSWEATEASVAFTVQ
jgi:hypothetical protein